jgi:exonuclease SbcD
MRILHLADLHIGKIFHDVYLTDDQVHILDQIVAIAKDRNVDIVAITGDIYDRSMPPVQATVVMDEFLTRLVELGIRVILTPGNHDSAERLAFGGRLLCSRGLHIAPGLPDCIAPVVLEDRHGPVTFFPLPYIEPLLLKKSLDDPDIDSFDSALQSVMRSLAPCNTRTVCLAHCFTQGGITSESERPLSIGGSSLVTPDHFSRFNLTLLGHLHRPQRISDTIYYAGSPLKYSFSESDHQKQVAIYDLAADGSFIRETTPLTPLRDLRIIQGELEELLSAASSDQGRNDYLWITLTNRGVLFDYAAKIRDSYPNVLTITRTAYQTDRTGEALIEIRNRSDQEIVAAFFRHVIGEDLTAAEAVLMETILAETATGQSGKILHETP